VGGVAYPLSRRKESGEGRYLRLGGGAFSPEKGKGETAEECLLTVGESRGRKCRNFYLSNEKGMLSLIFLIHQGRKREGKRFFIPSSFSPLRREKVGREKKKKKREESKIYNQKKDDHADVLSSERGGEEELFAFDMQRGKNPNLFRSSISPFPFARERGGEESSKKRRNNEVLS